MKTMAVEIERNQKLRFFVEIPDHWGRAKKFHDEVAP